ncbi:hypothetical protein OSC27_08925 [Microbacterium sp. STN6]|uniref:hypothetical protein n=1 Tax=Microbacterium sp. STN6 TaxID=2995588 RepID=UPI002260958D|nr:hypothetical protein [Microbacterium sp. STN6]MCX7522399.1 hypothetical protein [Microbacterium sp. STN6]
MSPRLLRLEAPSLIELRERVLAEYGPRARVVQAEKVTVGGIRGFFARHHYEATVELDEPSPPAHVLFDVPARVGLAALLDEADAEEAHFTGANEARPEPSVSTQEPNFAAIMDDLIFNTSDGQEQAGAPQAPPRPAAPTPAAPPLVRPGDLIVVAGMADDAARIAHSMSNTAVYAEVLLSGALSKETDAVCDRRTANAARAHGVQLEACVIVAYGLGSGLGISRSAITALTRIGADQLWLAVDAGRKSEDTARWVTAIAAATPVHGLAVEGTDMTASPASVNDLQIPIGWLNGLPSPTARL